MRAIVVTRGNGVDVIEEVLLVEEDGAQLTLKGADDVTLGSYLRADVATIELV